METVSISGDYATLDLADGTRFYYGYEYPDENDEWTFRVRGADKMTILFSLPFSKLGARDQFECAQCLLCGIGLYLSSM